MSDFHPFEVWNLQYENSSQVHPPYIQPFILDISYFLTSTAEISVGQKGKGLENWKALRAFTEGFRKNFKNYALCKGLSISNGHYCHTKAAPQMEKILVSLGLISEMPSCSLALLWTFFHKGEKQNLTHYHTYCKGCVQHHTRGFNGSRTPCYVGWCCRFSKAEPDLWPGCIAISIV